MKRPHRGLLADKSNARHRLTVPAALHSYISAAWAQSTDEVRQALHPRMAELGRSCVHADYRHGGVLLALWGALAEFMRRNQLDTMLGCASIPLQHGHGAADVWQRLRETHLAAPPFRVLPRLPLPVDAMDDALYAEPPALIRGYLRLGARVLGPPAWDPHFNTADLPIMMRMADMPAGYQRGPADG